MVKVSVILHGRYDFFNIVQNLCRRFGKIYAVGIFRPAILFFSIIMAIRRRKPPDIGAAVINMHVNAVEAAIFCFGAVPQFVGNFKLAVIKILYDTFGIVVIQNSKNAAVTDIVFLQQFFHNIARTAGNDVDFVPTAQGFIGKKGKIRRLPVDNAMVIQTDFKLIHPASRKQKRKVLSKNLD